MSKYLPDHHSSSRRDLVPRELSRATAVSTRPAAPGRSGPVPGNPAPEDPASDLHAYARILRTHWPMILGCCLAVTAAVAAGDFIKDPVYRASGTIEIRKQSAEVVPVEALFQFERISDQYLQTQYALLSSPTLVRRVLEDTALAAGLAEEKLGRRGTAEASRQLDELVERTRAALMVDPVQGSRIVKVTFEAGDPALASAFVNAVFDEYLEMRQEAGSGALEQFASQADTIRGEILAMEASLQDYVRANGLGMIVGVTGNREDVAQERLRLLQEELTRAEAEGMHAEALYGTARQQMDAALDSDLLKTLRARLAEVQAEYASVRSTFTDSFPRARQLRDQIADLNTQIAREQRRISASLGGQRQAAQSRSQLLRQAVSEQRALLDDLATKRAEYDRRQRELEGHRQLYATLQQKRKEATVASALSAVDVAVLDPAVAPMEPVSPLPKRDIPLGALVGLVLGVGLAFVRSYSDTTVRTLDQVEALSDRPVLALIPSVPTPRQQGVPVHPAGLIAAGKTHAYDDLAEAFRGLRTSVLFEAMGPLPRILLMSSAAPGEGKTFVTTNLALSLASLGRRVLLIDADLRRPAVHRVFNLKDPVGLSRCLSGDATLDQALWRDVVPGLDVLPSRVDSLNPSDLLSSPAMGKLLQEAAAEYDFVLLDAPALFINVPDARILAQKADGVLLVVRSGVTPKDLVRRLATQTPNLVGIVLNGYDLRQLPASYAAYGERVATV